MSEWEVVRANREAAETEEGVMLFDLPMATFCFAQRRLCMALRIRFVKPGEFFFHG